MPSTHPRQPRLIAPALPIMIGLALAACSSSPSSSTTSPASSPTPSASSSSSVPPATGNEPTSGAGAIAAIKANWAAFFNAKTPNSRRVQLLQDGQMFTAVLKAQSANPLASQASATVSKVSLTSASQANVTYTILAAGAPVLSNQKGVAVYQNGVWKVGFASFCGLLILQNAGKTTGLPSVCKG